MNSIIINKLDHKIKKEITIPWSKSITNRALFLSFLWEWKSIVKNPLRSDDTRYMLDALHKLWAWIAEHNNEIEIWWLGWKVSKWNKELFLWNAWTAVRFLTAFAWIQSSEIIIDWNERMRERPLKDLIEWIKLLWANVETNNFCPPVKILWNYNWINKITVKWDTSSQYISWLLHIAPLLENWLEIIVDWELVSKPYIDVTIDVMRLFNIIVENNNYKSFHVAKQKYASTIFEVEADASSSSYFESIAAITESEITINLPYTSMQWDAKFVDVLEKIWATIEKEGSSMTIKWNKNFKEVWEIDMNKMPDVAMTLAVIAPLLPWTTRIINVENMRVKETDRIYALVTELKKLWVNARELKDWLEIEHCKEFKKWVKIETYDDHRMAMCFAVLWAKIWWIEILNPECSSKTYPSFFKELLSLY